MSEKKSKIKRSAEGKKTSRKGIKKVTKENKATNDVKTSVKSSEQAHPIIFTKARPPSYVGRDSDEKAPKNKIANGDGQPDRK